MMMNRTVGTGGLVMMLVVALAAIGIGIALWSKVLTIQGVVRTGAVNAQYEKVFTDDDDAVDNPEKDGLDTGDCPISIGPETPPALFPDKKTTPGTSCDPAQTGRDPKRHYDKDVARCDAVALPDGQDEEPQPGSQRAVVLLLNAYPSYHCTAWFDVVNSGTIPVLLHSVALQGKPAAPCAAGASTPYDLNGDGLPDIEICVSELPICPTGQCEPQIDPGVVFQFNLDIHVMQTAPQAASLQFDASLCLHQWNEETGNCPEVTPTPGPLPDLVCDSTEFPGFCVEGVSFTSFPDGECLIDFEVQNIGAGPAGASTARITTDTGASADVPTPALAPGGTVNLTATLPAIDCSFDPDLSGTYDVDVAGAVAESNEGNNSGSWLILG